MKPVPEASGGPGLYQGDGEDRPAGEGENLRRTRRAHDDGQQAERGGDRDRIAVGRDVLARRVVQATPVVVIEAAAVALVGCRHLPHHTR